MRARAIVLVMIGMQLHSSRKSVREKDATMRGMRSTYFFIAAGLQYAAVCDKSARSPLLAATEAAGAVSEGTSTQRSRSLEALLSLVELEPNVTTRQSGLDEMMDMSRPDISCLRIHTHPDNTNARINPHTRPCTHVPTITCASTDQSAVIARCTRVHKSQRICSSGVSERVSE